MTDVVLTIDQGGHATRAMAFDVNARVVAESTVAVETQRTGSALVEMDPEDLIDSVSRSVELCCGQLDSKYHVTAAGLATQRSSVVCWDRQTGRPLSPVLSWQDRRAATWVAGMESSREYIYETTGLMLSPHYGMSKLRWCLDNIPEVAEALKADRLAWGPISSFILFRVLDSHPHLVDPANASRTLLWDLHTRQWSPKLLELYGLPREPLPCCVPSRNDFGHLSVSGGGTMPLTICTGDQSAALFALGQPREDSIYINMGTGAFVQQVCSGMPPRVPGLLRSVVHQSSERIHFALEGTVNGAGSAVSIMAEELGIDSRELETNSDQWLRNIKDPPLFLNGVSGLGSPYWAPEFQSMTLGQGDAAATMVGVLESIVFLIRVNLDAFASALPRPARLVLTGGLATVDALCQRLANLSGVFVFRPQLSEATSLGLARLLARDVVDVDKNPDSFATFSPVEDGGLERRFARWKQMMERNL